MKKKLIAVILCMAMTGTVFSGCGVSDKNQDKLSNKEIQGSTSGQISNEKDDTGSEQKQEQIDFIQAEYRIVDVKELSVNQESRKVSDNRDKESVLQNLIAHICGIAGAVDFSMAKEKGLITNPENQEKIESVKFVGVPCTDKNGKTLAEVASVFQKVFQEGILNELFACKPEYKMVSVDGEEEKWYQFTWNTDHFFEKTYAKSYLEELSSKKDKLKKAIKQANNGSDVIEITVSPETVAKCLDRYNMDSDYWFVFDSLDDYNADSWTYDMIYHGVRYSSNVTNDDVKIMIGKNKNGTLKNVVMQQWYSDLLLDKDTGLMTNEEIFQGNDKYQSIAYSEDKILELEKEQRATFDSCGLNLEDYR